MGVVYQATDLSLDRPVALKLIAPELGGRSALPRAVPRGAAAGRLAGPLERHPDLRGGRARRSAVPRDALRPGERPQDAAAARGRARPGARAGDPRPDRGRARRGAPAAASCTATSSPRTCSLDEDEHAYLTDFGVTKQLGDDTSEAEVAGTLDYLAPEQIRGEPIDGRTDGYALACVLYECLAGTPPFRRQTPAETLWAHLREEPPPLESHPALDPVLRRGLAQERDERYPTCAALIDAARDVARRRAALRASSPRAAGRRGWSSSPARSTAACSPLRPGEREPPPRLRPGTASPRSGRRRSRSTAFVETAARAEQHRASARAPSGSSTRRTTPSRAWILRPRRSPAGSRRRACRPTSPRAPARYGSAPAAAKAATGRTPSTGSIPGRARSRTRVSLPGEARQGATALYQRRLPADRGRRRRRCGRPAAAPSRASTPTPAGSSRRSTPTPTGSPPAARASGSSARTTPAP